MVQECRAAEVRAGEGKEPQLTVLAGDGEAKEPKDVIL